MANGYNLTVQLNLQGPSNVNSIVNNINRQLGNINANVNLNLPANAAKQLAQVNSNLQQTARAANTATSGMDAFGKAAGLAVKRFGAFTVATAGFYAVTRATQQSLAKFIEFDKQITRIAQVSNSTKQSLSGLSSEITKLSVSLGASSSELASIAVTLSQAGLSARETEKALKALALTTLAPTFNDLNQTVEGSIALMKQFSISTNQLEKALGSINAVAGNFAVEASDLITAVQRAGGVFAAASQGVSTGTDALNEFLAVFTSVRATTRESAETIATGLRTIFTRIQREDTISALEAFGVTLTDLEGKFVGPYKAIEQLAKGLGRLDPRSLQFSNIIEELGGFRQVGKVIPLIQRFTTAQQALNVAQQGSGSLARDAAIGQQSLAVQISKVKEEFDALIRSIGETSEFKQFIRLSLDLASALLKIADAVKPVLPALAALGTLRLAGGIGTFARGFRTGISGGTKGFNKGGLVPGSGNTDTVRANLTPGEYVIRKQAVQAIGVNNLAKMNKYALGGPVRATGAEIAQTYGSLRNRVNPEQLYTANVERRPVPTQDIIRGMKARKAKVPSMYPWQNFELAVAKKYGMTSVGGQSFLDFPKQLAEAKFLRPDAVYSKDKETGFLKGNNNKTMLAKLVGSGLYSPGETVSVFYPQNHSEVVRQLQTKKETAEKAAKKTKKGVVGKRVRKADGGPVQRFTNGGEAGAVMAFIKFADRQLRGTRRKRGSWMDRDAAFDKKHAELLKDYENAPLGKAMPYLKRAQEAFEEYSIREMEFVTPQLQSVGPNITPALMLEGLRSGKIGYGTGIDPKFPKRTPVFFGEKVTRLTSASKRQDPKNRKADIRTQRNMSLQFIKIMRDKLGISEEDIKKIDPKALDNIVARAFRDSKSGVASKVAAYADVSNFKPGLIAYGKGQGTFGDVVKAFDSKIRSELANDPKLLGHYEGMLKAGTWADYLTSGGKAGHMPALKKKLYSIVGVTERNLGGPIERLSRGGSPEDTVPALLTPGEYVINADAAAAIGQRRLNELNNADRIGYNRGGLVGHVQKFKTGGSTSVSSQNTNFIPLASVQQAAQQAAQAQQQGAGSRFGGMDNLFTVIFGVQAAASALQSTFDETTQSGAASAASIQGFTSGLTGALVTLEAFKMLPVGNLLGSLGSKLPGAIGAVVVGLSAIGSATAAYLNAQKELEKKLAGEKLTNSLDKASTSLEDITKGTAGAVNSFNNSLLSAAESASKLRDSQNEYRYSLIGSPIDYFSSASNQEKATRSRILEQDGVFAYFDALFDPDVIRQRQEQFLSEDRKQSAKASAEIARAQIQRGSQIIEQGGTLSDVARQIPMEIRREMARSNVDVAELLDSTSDPRQRENIINQEVAKQLQTSLGPQIAAREAAAADQAVQQLQVALGRVFDNMEQRFNAVASNIDSQFGRVADSFAASIGNTTIGYNNSAIKTILDNPKAFSDAQLQQTIGSISPLLGNKGGRVGQLALASTRIEEQIANIIDRGISGGGEAESQLGNIRGELGTLIQNLNLGRDIEVLINDQLKAAFEQASKELGDAADPTLLRQRVQEIVANLPAFNGALDIIKQAFETFSSAQNRYSQAVQSVTQAILQQRDYFNKASTVRRQSSLDLRRTLGETIKLDDIIRDVSSAVMDQTGGLTSPTELFRQQQSLLLERERITKRRDDISGDATKTNEFIRLSEQLIQLDTQLSKNRSGLELLANSTQIASAALNEYTRIQQQGVEKAGFAERLVSSTPQELRSLRQDFNALQNIMNGGELNLSNSAQAQEAMKRAYAEGGNYFQVMQAGQEALASQRGSTLSLMKELKPFFGDDNKAFNQSYEKVLRSYLGSMGMMGPEFEQMFKEISGDTNKQQKALQVYDRAVSVQIEANQALGSLILPMELLHRSNFELISAINNLTSSINTVPGINPQARSNGGVIYASKGQLVNMQPKGTDTVPAMLTPGEFVVNAKATRKNRGLLEHINGGGGPSISRGISYAADGGFMERALLNYQVYYRNYKEMYGNMPMPLAMRGQMKMMAIQQAQYEWMMEQQGDQQQRAVNPADTPRMRALFARKEEEKKRRQQRIEKRKNAIEEKRRKEQEDSAPPVTNTRFADPDRVGAALERAGYRGRQETKEETKPEERRAEEFNPFDDSNAVVRRYNPRTGQIEIINPQTGQVINRVGPSRSPNQFLDRPRAGTVVQSPGAGNGQFNTVGLEARATSFLNREQNNLDHVRGEREQAYGGIGGSALYAVHWLQGGYGQAFYDDQIKEGQRKIERIKYAQRLLARANDPDLPYKQRVEAYQEAYRILYGAHLNSARFSGGPTEYNQITQDASNTGSQYVFEGVAGLVPVGRLAQGANRARAAGQSVFSMSRAARTGSTAAKAGSTAAAKGGTKAATETGEQLAEKGLLPHGTPTSGRIEIGVQGPSYSQVRISPGPGTNAGTAASNANAALRYRPPVSAQQATDAATRSRLGYASGGIVKPAYLANGGGAWQFEDLASGYWTYNALNTDYANVADVYSVVGKYASPREKSYNRIKYQGGDYGIHSNQAIAKGFGYDAAGRPVFESRYGYTDTRSDLRDERNIFGVDRYPGYMASGGLARGKDKYPAMLSRGEMVMNAEATKRNEGLLRALNKSSGGIVSNGILYAQNGTDGPIGGGGGAAQLIMGSSTSSPLSDALNGFNISSIILAPQLEAFSVSATSLSDNFGVFKDGATQMEQAAGLLGNASRSFRAPIDTFRQSVQDFASKTSNLISAINNMGEINGTINVRGQIEILPLDVNVIGLEILQPLISNIQNQVLSVVGNALANDNPGININSLSTSSLL